MIPACCRCTPAACATDDTGEHCAEQGCGVCLHGCPAPVESQCCLHADRSVMPLIDIWAVLTDPDIPRDVGRRLLARTAAAKRGLPIPPCPEADRPYLARHEIRLCEAHDKAMHCDGGWRHLFDGHPCRPKASDETSTHRNPGRAN